MWSRRAFLKAGAVGMFSLTLGGTPLFLCRTAQAATTKKPQTLVCIFQRGAMDGLMAVTPFGDPNLRTLRPRIAMGARDVIDLDGRFGLHPGFRALEPLYRSGKLAIVHGMGSPDNTRSHFDAQDYMETGTPGRKGTRTGWLNRAAGLMGHDHTPFSAVAMTSAMPRSLYGDFPALAVSDLSQFGVQESPGGGGVSAGQSLEALYNNTTQDLLKGTGKDSFTAVKQLSKEAVRSYRPANGAQYPAGQLGQALKQIAYLIKSGLGLEVAFTESAGWDTHVNQGTGQGTFFQRSQELGNSIAAFWTDLGAYQDHVAVMTMTEFGRTCGENGSGGTDHGRGSCCFVLGKRVKGNQVYGQVPTLSKENLEDQRDLPVTTDFRAVFSEVAVKHLRVPAGESLFPGYAGPRLTLMT